MSNQALRKKAKRPPGQPLNCFRCNRTFQPHFKDCVEARVAGGALLPLPASHSPRIGKAESSAGIPLQGLGKVGQPKAERSELQTGKGCPHRGHLLGLPSTAVIAELLELAGAIQSLYHEKGETLVGERGESYLLNLDFIDQMPAT